MAAPIEQQFHAAMLGLHHKAKEAGYNASYFLRMVNEMGGVAAAKQLLASQRPSDGFTRLWELGRLDITVEALVLEPRFAPLFTMGERMKARRWLEEHGYRPR